MICTATMSIEQRAFPDHVLLIILEELNADEEDPLAEQALRNLGCTCSKLNVRGGTWPSRKCSLCELVASSAENVEEHQSQQDT
jgi:hypothetical protein